MDTIDTTIESSRIRSIRRNAGLTQQEFAEEIGVAKVTVARWESGSRACLGQYAKLVLKFATAKVSNVTRTTAIFDVRSEHLSVLDATSAVEALRDLLWCECTLAGLPRSEVHIGMREIADGGIDAALPSVPKGSPSTFLKTGANYFQIKAGSSWKPWQPSFAKKELLSKQKELNTGVKECLEEHGQYILACFGTDLTVEQRTKARGNLREVFQEAGYANTNVVVWGQQELIGLFGRFPSLCMKLSGTDRQFSLSWSSWNTSQEMSVAFKRGEAQDQLIKDIHLHLRGEAVSHIRVCGEPGLGKTRLVHEALAAEDLAPNVVYFPHAEDFQKSQFFNDLLRPDADFFVILVLDECLPRECAEIWDRLGTHSDRCRVISLDHASYDPIDNGFVEIDCPKLVDKLIAEIIGSYTPDKIDTMRWAEYCSGSPRVAHAIGHNLKTNPMDMLCTPSMKLIWDRFVSGYRAVDDVRTREKLTVLRHIALFHRFGFETPVDHEGMFIASLVQKNVPDITPARFQEIVRELQQQRVLQGKTTLFIAPRLLHIHLWQEFWEFHGLSQSLSDLIKIVPKTLFRWFVTMFSYATESRVASENVKTMLGVDGPFGDREFALSEEGCHFLHELANGAPQDTLRCLERLINSLSREELLEIKRGRQHIVWALERIAVWPNLFSKAARLLRTLATAETDSNLNNSTGTFIGLFSLAPGQAAPTAATPDQRLPVLTESLESDSLDIVRLGVKACAMSLSIHSGTRVIGAEYQGLKTVELWAPETWTEVSESRLHVWELLFNTSRGWGDDIRSEANEALINAATGLLQIDLLALRVLDTLELLLTDDIDAIDLRELAELITSIRVHHHDHYGVDVLARLESLDQTLTGTSFADRVRRVIHLSSWHDPYDAEGRNEEEFDQRVDGLAIEAADSDERFQEILPELITGTNNLVFRFARVFAQHDNSRRLQTIINVYGTTPGQTALFLGGYLAALFETDPIEWERIIKELLEDDRFSAIISAIIRNSGSTDNVIHKLLGKYDSGRLTIDCLLSFGHWPYLKKLQEDTFLSLIERLQTAGNVEYALQLLDYVYCDECDHRSLPETKTLTLLCTFGEGEFCGHGAYYSWSRVANQFLNEYPSRQVKLFEDAIRQVGKNHWFLNHNNYTYGVVQEIVKADPEECWTVVAKLLDGMEEMQRYRLLLWLGPEIRFGSSEIGCGPLTLFPLETVFDWIAEDPEKRAYEVAKLVRAGTIKSLR